MNEDCYKILELELDLYYFVVFDGYGGLVVVEFVSEYFYDCIKNFYRSDKSIECVLVEVFVKCNNDLKEYCEWFIEKGKVWSSCK